jgi:hypothetical protein
VAILTAGLGWFSLILRGSKGRIEQMMARGAGPITIRNLSSRLTFLYKLVFPVWWVGVFAVVTATMFIAPDSFTTTADTQMTIKEFRMVFLAATIAGAIGFYWLCMRLKKVTLTDDVLAISNFLTVIQVPLRDVERVSGSILLSPELVWLHFRVPTEFGSKVVFAGKMRLFCGFSVHPLVDELQALMRKERR